MSGENFNLVEAARQLSRTPWQQHARTAVIAAVEAIPFLGGTLSTLLSEYLPEWKLRQVVAFLETLAADVERLKDKVNQKDAGSAEYGLLLEHVLQQVSRTGEKDYEKLRAYRSILLNTCLPSAPEKMERDYFLDLVERLREVHIVLLSLFRDQYAFAKAHGLVPPRNESVGSLGRTISAYLSPLHIPEPLADAAIRDLDTMGILPGTFPSLQTTMSGHGSTDLTSRLKDFGRRFAEFIALPNEVR